MRRFFFASALALALGLLPSTASAVPPTVSFASGSLIIPMDVDYQDVGMLRSFGLLDKLLRAGVSVNWCIKTPKTVVDTTNGRFESDFTAAAKDFVTNATISDLVNGTLTGTHAYRGGPFVIDASLAAAAAPIITTFQAASVLAKKPVNVHVATAAFQCQVAKRLTAAPRIAIFNDGNGGIATAYLNAAGIPDENGYAWPMACPSTDPSKCSVDLLSKDQVAGPDFNNPKDGALFTASGQPAFCEIMTMHWAVTDTVYIPPVTAEMAQFLNYPVHLNAECQAVNAVEGAPPIGGNQKFVAPQGFVWPAPNQPAAVEFANSSLPFAQMDGPFVTVGGSEPAYELPVGSSYYDSGIVMVRAKGQPLGVQDIWMTGYAGGACAIASETCNVQNAPKGKVSYLGGHTYTTATPMSTNGKTQGTRLFLNSLYEAGCVDGEGQPVMTVTKDGPTYTSDAQVTYTITYENTGPGPAIGFKLTDALPTGATFVSATGGGTFASGVVTWNLGDVPSLSGPIQVQVTLRLPALGLYSNRATATFKTGLTSLQINSNTVKTTYGAPLDMSVPPDLTVPLDLAEPPDAGVPDLGACGGGCPAPANPCQVAMCVNGMCTTTNAMDGAGCTLDACTTGATCMAGVCQGGSLVKCPAPSSVCLSITCDPALGCVTRPANDGMSCSTGDACIVGATCATGVCQGGSQKICPRPVCAQTTCDPLAGCSSTFVAANTDPAGDCASCGATCDGNGACTPCPPDLLVDVDMAMGTDDAFVADDLTMSSQPDLVMGGTDDLLMTAPDLAVAADLTQTMSTDDGGADGGTDGGGGGDLASSGPDMTGVDMTGMDMTVVAGPDLAMSGGGNDLSSSGGSADMTGGGVPPGGCGCTVGARPTNSSGPALAVGLVLALVGLVRRRRVTRG